MTENEQKKLWGDGFTIGAGIALVVTMIVAVIIAASSDDGLSWYSKEEMIIEYGGDYYKLIPVSREFKEKGDSDNESRAGRTEGAPKAAPVTEGEGRPGSRDPHDDD